MMNSEPSERSSLKSFVKSIPVLGPTAGKLAQLPVFARVRSLHFPGSATFWESVYRQQDGTSGPGSYGRLAQFKAEILNEFVRTKAIRTVIDFGCGDGAQLQLARYPEYLGVDVARGSIERCNALFANDSTKRFCLADKLPQNIGEFDLALSLDVVYHLVENTVFDAYMRRLFDASQRHVIIYSSNYDALTNAPHVRHRNFTRWIDKKAPDWCADGFVPNRFPFHPKQPDDETSHADFYFFTRKDP
jgi:cyclopropane fatty-acyl-phospholipid synthase-like methyltransferase